MESSLRRLLTRPYVHIVFGARQTGKSTLLRAILPEDALVVDLSRPGDRDRFSASPDDLIRECEVLPKRRSPHFVLVDEAQVVPRMFDAVQHLYDGDKARWRFVLCGSSARKLRATGANLLPGRSFLHRIFPLTLAEHPPAEPRNPHARSPLPFHWPGATPPESPFPTWGLEERLAWGALPGVVASRPDDRARLLQAYAEVHLEEEIRRETVVKDWGAFVRFLRLASAESGQTVNFANLAGEVGLSHPTVKSHYQLLEDMFMGIMVPAFSGSTRKRLLSTPRFLFFDLGVRNAAAGLTPGTNMVRSNPGPLFEQWVGIELWKRLQYLGSGSLSYYRTKDGAEVDFVIEQRGNLLPIEVKWTANPSSSDARHLRTFLDSHPRKARHGWIICRCPRPQALDHQITALPWHCL